MMHTETVVFLISIKRKRGSTEEAEDRIGGEVARKLVDYSDVGSTFGAVNFPQVQLPARPTGTRFIHGHGNVPGVMRQVNDAVSRHGINILAQHLQTDPEVGYVVLETDVLGGEGEELLTELRGVPGTIRVRVLYDQRVILAALATDVTIL
jgi:D-3-phosphoglycerate dehydrogenase / 2-oxoglutarate reductase